MSVQIGSYFPERQSPPLSIEQAQIVNLFHDLCYRRWITDTADTLNLSWFGYEICKNPLDLWIYQELLVKTRPDVVIETGTYRGGSALYLAMIFDMIGHGAVLTIDVQEPRPDYPEHPRITYLVGSSTDPALLAEVTGRVHDGRAFVILDSDHHEPHVYNEMVAYSPFVRPGDYLIVEDTNINGHPTYPDFGPGPMEAVQRFLSDNDTFQIDERCERFMMTQHPKGYLRRSKPDDATV